MNAPFQVGGPRQRSGNMTKRTLSWFGHRKGKIKNCSGAHWSALRPHVLFPIVQLQQKMSSQFPRHAPWNLNFMPVNSSWVR